jgi:hypothetical protein
MLAASEGRNHKEEVTINEMGSHFLTNVSCYQFDEFTTENAVNHINDLRVSKVKTQVYRLV